MRGIVCQSELVFTSLLNHIFGSNSELNVWTIYLVPCSNLSHIHTRHTLSVPYSDWITVSIDLHHFEITGLKTKCIVQWYLALNCDCMSLCIVWVDRLGSGSSFFTGSCSHETYHFLLFVSCYHVATGSGFWILFNERQIISNISMPRLRHSTFHASMSLTHHVSSLTFFNLNTHSTHVRHFIFVWNIVSHSYCISLEMQSYSTAHLTWDMWLTHIVSHLRCDHTPRLISLEICDSFWILVWCCLDNFTRPYLVPKPRSNC